MQNSFWNNIRQDPEVKVETEHTNISHLDQLEKFKSWIADSIGIYPTDLSPSGTIAKYHDPSITKNDNRVRIFCDISAKGTIYGWCQNHGTMGEPLYYTPERHTKLTDQQIAEYKKHADERRKIHEADKEKKRLEIADYVSGLAEIQAPSPYMEAKKISGSALAGENCIVLPITDVCGTIYGMQKIYHDGTKIINGSYSKGKHILIPGDSSTVLVCEGWATGVTLNKVTGHAVYCALSKNGLGPVTKVLKDQGVDSIIICSDNDWQKQKNEGLEEAQRVGEAQGVPVVWPEFNGLPGSDWNDLANLTSPDEVSRQLKDVSFNPILDAIYAGNDLLELKPFDFVIKNFYQIDETNMIFAGGGVGKSLFTMAQAVSIVTGIPILGQQVTKQGPVVYYNAEDPINTMLLRLHAILRTHKIPVDAVKDLKLISGRQSAGSRGKRMVLATLDNKRVTKGRDFDNFMDVIKSVDPVAVFLDPLVKMHEGCNENSNEDIEGVMGFCSELQDGDVRFALIMVHHVGKIATETLRGQDSVGRGASAAYDHSRSCWLITRPIEAEVKKAESLGYDPRFMIRLDCKKATNFAMPKEQWYSKELYVFDDVKSIDGDPTTVAYIQQSDFAEGASQYDKERAIEKANREDLAIKWIDSLLKEKGAMTKKEIYEAMGPLQIDYWGDTYKTYENKIGRYRENFSTFYRGRTLYYESTN